MFYKLENRGESIHADLNSIERKIWCNRQPEECLWKYIEKFKLRNLLDITIKQTEKKEEGTNELWFIRSILFFKPQFTFAYAWLEINLLDNCTTRKRRRMASCTL